ncbi:MAG TPA: T7SS effector LXG polymorphic toxin [Ureibacillus sp.]|nr:T7SS effector LXG polymorphic toxin [Peribacillus asahii]HWL26153.1 T7SS effector LXG polymorphic toxin [Ureibacillus sp.]
MSEVEAAIQGFIELEDSFKGKGGEAVRDFMKKYMCHLSLIIGAS